MLMILALVLTIALLNVAIGFALAVCLGHGPALPANPALQLRRRLRQLLRLERPAH
jgi:hypothetical protein